VSLRFDEPWWLLGVLLVVPMAALAWRWMATMGTGRRWTAVAVRVGLVAALLGMLGGATAVRSTDRVAVIAVVDVSDSVRTFGAVPSPERTTAALTAARAFLTQATENRTPTDLLGVVAVADGTAAVSAPVAGEVLDRPLETVPGGASDLEAGIRLAQALFPSDAARRIVLVSDGNQTQGDVLAAARRAGASGPERTPIDVLPIRYSVEREVLVEAVDVPGRAQLGATVTARVTLLATQATRGVLRLRREGEDLPIGPGGALGRPVELRPGRNVELVSVTLDQGRVHRFEAFFEPAEGAGDSVLANNRAEGVTITPGKGSILLVDGVSGREPGVDGELLARTLRSEGLEVRVVPPEGFERDLIRMQEYDLIVLQNANAGVIDTAAQQSLVRYVTELGGGLVMVGGPESLGPGGYRGGPLEPILPVRLELPDRLVMPSAAVVLVIDDSGSMSRSISGSARSQQDVANEGAALAVRSLDQSDLVGVITFNGSHEVLIPLGPNTDSKRSSAEIMGISPGGGTNLPPALEEAIGQLQGAEAKVKHIIVLSDGQSQGRDQLPDLARLAKQAGIRISSIAVGDTADVDALQALARSADGEFYRVADPNILPRVFLRAVRVVRSPMIREEPFTPVVVDRGSPLIEGVDTGAIPPLNGLVLTQPRSERTVLYPLMSPGGEPVLAHWQAGLGQVAVFTSDAHHWAQPWIGWPGYRRIWLQVARTIARGQADRQIELSTEVVGDRLRVRVEATDDQRLPIDDLSLTGSVFTPDDRRVEVRMMPVGPGSYEGTVPAEAAGNYVVALTPRRGGRALAPVVGGVSRPAGMELRFTQHNEGLLRQIADESGGRVLDWARPREAGLFSREGLTPREARLPLLPLLLGLAVALLLLDVATRKIAWDRLIDRGSLAEAQRALQQRGEQAAATLSSLRRTEERLDARDTPGRALTAEDAQTLAERERARRRTAAAIAADEPSTERAIPLAGAKPEPQPAQPSAGGEPPEGEQGAASLLAAKRRARQRFGDEGR
jgi:Ca-activated chloride channel family protein